MEYLKKPTSADAAEQCRQMGISVGDMIEGRETHANGWNEARLELIWLGEKIAVFRERSRSHMCCQWTMPREEASWTLDCRRWRKVPSNAK